MKKYRWPIVAAIAVCCVAVVYFYCCLPVTTVILVRHAEKGSEPGNNPSLTAAGQARAQNLVSVLEQAGVSAVYATQFCRTLQTADPVASDLGLTIQVQTVPNVVLNPSACTPPVQASVSTHTTLADHVAEFSDRVRQDTGKAVLVVGHSDTVPQLIEALGVSPAPVIAANDYGQLFIVSLRSFREPRLIEARYGQ